MQDKTIISIAHRLLTLHNFDKIIELENGKIKKAYEKVSPKTHADEVLKDLL